uniref:Uncharacterized protein n=1 Tax=Mustela putorius furo TaxID=9669 RepID=M3XPZ4_MUSPF
MPPAHQLSALLGRRGDRTPNTARGPAALGLPAGASHTAPNPGSFRGGRTLGPESHPWGAGSLRPGARGSPDASPTCPASAPPAWVPAPRDCGRRAAAEDAAPSAGERAPAGNLTGSAAAEAPRGCARRSELRACGHGERQGGAGPGRSLRNHLGYFPLLCSLFPEVSRQTWALSLTLPQANCGQVQEQKALRLTFEYHNELDSSETASVLLPLAQEASSVKFVP